jgi:hypothetical protein
MMERDDFLRVFHPIHLHFTSDYDAIKYSNKVKSIPKINDRSNDVRMRLVAGRFDTPKKALKFCLANFACGETDWVYGDLASADEVYKAWQKRTMNLKRTLQDDYDVYKSAKAKKNMVDSEMLASTKTGNNPPLLQLCLQGYVSREFITVLDNGLRFIDTWRDTLVSDPLVKKELFRLTKYKPFVMIIQDEQKKK